MSSAKTVTMDVAPAMAAAKLGMIDKLLAAIEKKPSLSSAVDGEGRTCLHYAAGYGHEECVERLLEKQFDPIVQDKKGDTALHLAATQGCPMSAFNLTKAAPAACLTKNHKQQRPADVAKACERGEVLNAMLLACSGDATSIAVEAMQFLLQEGAVPDTWAPNGSSALMLAASVDGVAAMKLLLKHGATIELQDALGRSALMFAAGNSAEAALLALLAAGATLGLRDRRSRSVLDYAPEGTKVKQQLLDRLEQLEAAAEQLQAALLAELNAPAPGPGTSRKKGKAKKGKKKQAAVPESEEATLASQQHPGTSSHMPTDSAQTPLSALVDSATGDVTAAAPQHLLRQLDDDHSASVEVPTSSIHLSDQQQTGKMARPQVDCAGQDGFSPEHPSSAAPDNHLCQHSMKPEETNASLATSSSKSPCSGRQVSPTSGVSAPAESAPAATLSHGIHQQVAVLSVLVGAAANPAALTLPLLPDATDPSAAPQASAANPLVEERPGLGSNSASSSSSLDIYDALREDRAHSEDWQLVKASKKASTGSIKATLDTGEKQTGAAQHPASKRKEQLVESHVRSQEAAHEAAGAAGDATHVAKPVPRSSSQASVLSWMSVDTVDMHDRFEEESAASATLHRCFEAASNVFGGVGRLHPRTGSTILAQNVKPSHASKPPPPPSFKTYPPPPPGPPPSAVHPTPASAARSQGSSAPAPEPRRNAWEQPLPGHRLSKPPACSPGPLRLAADVESSPSRGSHMLSHLGPHGNASLSGSSSALGSKCDAKPDFGAATMTGQQGDMAEAAPSSPAQVTEPAGRSSTAAAAAPVGQQSSSSPVAGQYPQEAEHVAQIADLQEEVTALRGDVAHLFLALKAAEARHEQELAGVIIDAAHHQTKAVAEAVAKERAATAAMLQSAAAQQSAMQHRAVAGFDSRAPSHLSRQRQQQLPIDQDPMFTRSRLGNTSTQQVHRSPDAGMPAGPALPAGQHHSVPRHTSGHAQDRPTPADSVVEGPALGITSGTTRSPSAEELREGFRRAVSALPDEPRMSKARADNLLPCSINNVLPHVASWGNLSNHSSSSNSGLLHNGLHDTTSRGLPSFEPVSTPAGLFNSNGSTACTNGTFPSYLASIWSGDAKAESLSGSPNGHFEQPSLLNNHQ